MRKPCTRGGGETGHQNFILNAQFTCKLFERGALFALANNDQTQRAFFGSLGKAAQQERKILFLFQAADADHDRYRFVGEPRMGGRWHSAMIIRHDGIVNCLNNGFGRQQIAPIAARALATQPRARQRAHI